MSQNVNRITATTTSTTTTSPTSSGPTTAFTSEKNIQLSQNNVPTASIAVRPNQLTSSMSNSELSKSIGLDPQQTSNIGEQIVRKSIGKWNPFEDPTPFSQMTEDHIFDAEFDAIRQRGSQNSMVFFFFINILIYILLIAYMICVRYYWYY